MFHHSSFDLIIKFLTLKISLWFGGEVIITGCQIWCVGWVLDLLEASFLHCTLGNSRLVDWSVLMEQTNSTAQRSSPLLLESVA